MSSTKNLLTAQRYAKSLLGEDNAKVQNYLEKIKSILALSTELYDVLCAPPVSVDDKKAVIESVFKNDVDTHMMSFLKLLVSEGRFNLIYDIISAFNSIVDKLNNVLRIDVISAIELNEDYKKQIEQKLNEKLNKEIAVNYLTDSSIIAGLVYKTEDKVFDTSVKHKLEKFKYAITK